MIQLRSHSILKLLIISVALEGALNAVSRDSRYWPWIPREYSRTPCTQSRLSPNIFFMTGHSAFDREDRAPGMGSTGIPEILGIYNQDQINKALLETTGVNYLAQGGLGQLQGNPIIWHMTGKLEAQGVKFAYNQHIYDPFSIGIACAFMHVFSRGNFDLPQQTINNLDLSPAQQVQLDLIRLQMNKGLKLSAPVWGATGPTDIDLYIRAGHVWSYPYKFRRIDAGIKAGFLIPTGVMRDPNNPASVPFGADGIFGMYAGLDSEFELKEDWKVGLWLQINQRFKKTLTLRMPVANEQQLYGAAVVPVNVDPGYSIIFSPYAKIEGIQDGLGLGLRYTLLYHDHDIYTDARVTPIPPLTLGNVNRLSEFSSEYITFNLFYDFSKVHISDSFTPSLWLTWDFPIRILVAEGSVKTNRISFGVEWIF